MQIVIDLSIEVKRRVAFTFAQAVPSRLFAMPKRITTVSGMIEL